MRRSRLGLAALMVLAGLFVYYRSKQVNPVTGEKQAIALSPEQEVALGLQAAPEMAAQFGGADADSELQNLVAEVGRRVVSRSRASQTPYEFHFTLLADPDTVNAFALPGGPIFVTRGLLRLLDSEAELAGVLGHETGHVAARHASEQLAKTHLAQVLVGAAGVAASDSGHGADAAQVAGVVATMAALRYGRQDELQADSLGVDFMSDAGYDPRGLIRLMSILERAGGGSRQPEFLSTHPDPGNRAERIRAEIARKYPSGVPPNLTEGRKLGPDRPSP